MATDEQNFQQVSFSQFGEDAVLKWLFNGRTHGFYVDVGCHHPLRFSNTAALFRDASWHGINIDVDARAIAAFDALRPNDINVLIGVAAEEGQREVFFFEEGAINTFDEASADHPAWSHMTREKRLVDVKPLCSILAEHLPAGQQIDLLTIDAEGIDLEVLKSNDWAMYSPEIVLVEAHELNVGSASGNPTYDFMVRVGYELISHVALTSIFRRSPRLDESLSVEQIVWLYRCFLNRDPEDAATIARIQRETKTFAEARSNLMNTAEFTMNLPSVAQIVYVPERHPKPFVKSNRKLALATIVKNEETALPIMLQSCAMLIDYACVVDTGSSDATISIARRTLRELGIGHSVAERTFDTFSNARNAALALVPEWADWILMLDADEEIVQEDLWRFKELLENDEVDGWQLPRFNFSDAARRKPLKPYPDYQRRLFRNRPSNPVQFAGHVHEVPINVQQWGFAPQCQADGSVVGGPHIHHLGYIDIAQEQWQKKHDFYVGLRAREVKPV